MKKKKKGSWGSYDGRQVPDRICKEPSGRERSCFDSGIDKQVLVHAIVATSWHGEAEWEVAGDCFGGCLGGPCDQ